MKSLLLRNLTFLVIALVAIGCDKESETEPLASTDIDYRDEFVGSYFGMEYTWSYQPNINRDSALKTYSVQKSMNDSFVLIYNTHTELPDSVFIDINGEATKLGLNGRYWREWRIKSTSDTLVYKFDIMNRGGFGWYFDGLKGI